VAAGLQSNGHMLENVGASLEQYMNLVSARQKLVASNIANADTPGYQTKDIDFRTELANQMSGLEPAGAGKLNVIEVSGLETKNDGNNVDMDREARMLAENDLRFSVASSLLHSQITTLRSAIESGAQTS
jgi:flagellar basal-body rod protein FlgB